MLCRYLQEYSALGTAGGMYHFRDQILTGNPDLFFVMNADVCGDFPLQEMLEFHQSVDMAPHFTILGTEVCAKCVAPVTSVFCDCQVADMLKT